MVFKNVFSELKQPLSALRCRFLARFFDCVGQKQICNENYFSNPRPYWKAHLSDFLDRLSFFKTRSLYLSPWRAS